MKAIVTAALGVSLCLVLAVREAAAGGLNPEHVPADAKLVIHLDFDAFCDTTLANMCRQEHGPGINVARAWLIENAGMDLYEDVHGFTFFTNSYEPEVGSLVLTANFDQEKVEALLEEHADAETEEWRGHTLYTLEKKDKPGETFVLVLLDGEHAVFASSTRRAKQTVRLLAGRGESMADSDSGLVVDAPAGTVLYAAARNLDEIECELPIIQQHERIVYYVGESDGEVFDNWTLEAESEEVARNMTNVVNGFVSLFALWADGNEEILQLVEDTEVAREGTVVTKRYHGSTESLIAAMEVIKDRMPECCSHHGHHGWGHHGHRGHGHSCDCGEGECQCERGESGEEERACQCPEGDGECGCQQDEEE